MFEIDNCVVFFNNKFCSLVVIVYVNKVNIIDDDFFIFKFYDFSGFIYIY